MDQYQRRPLCGPLSVQLWRSLADSQVDVMGGLSVLEPVEPEPVDGRPVSVGMGPGSGMGWRVCAGHELELQEQRGAFVTPARAVSATNPLGLPADSLGQWGFSQADRERSRQAARNEASRLRLGEAGGSVRAEQARRPAEARGEPEPAPSAYREGTRREVREAVGGWVKSWDEERVVRGYVSRLGNDPSQWPDWEWRALTQTFIDRGWL